MSHLKERNERSCLNCNAFIHGKYCSICGQENLEPQESLWHLIVHFFNDITHFDGKFFSSLKYIITKPGFLTSEYGRGRRMSYLNPVRFYVFTSFIFFLIVFTFFKKVETVQLTEKAPQTLKKDSIKLNNALLLGGLDSIERNEIYKSRKEPEFTLKKLGDYKNRQEYDSLKKIGKTTKKWYKKILVEKQLDLQEKYGDDSEKWKADFKHELASVTPQILFLSLPFFAFLLKLLYLRRKKFYYVAHVIFTLHFYIFVYISILLTLCIQSLAQYKYFTWLQIPALIIGLSPFYYLYKAMRNFYEQGKGKTLLKFFILIIFLIFLICFFVILLLALSIYKM